MQAYNKIHLISDIHGHYQGLEAAAKLANNSEPLFVLGDIFDHHYGDEGKIIDLLLALDNKRALVLILGNHDLVIDIAFNQRLAAAETIDILTKAKNIKKFKIFEYLFSAEFFEQFLVIKEQLLEAGLDDQSKLERYYLQITELAAAAEYIDVYRKLQKALSLFVSHASVSVNGVRLLLSHSGDVNNPSSRATVKAAYKLDANYDYGVIGHLTIPKVEQMIFEEGDMLDFKQNFSLNPQLAGLRISGNYMYNSHSQTIMIDNGSDRQQAVTIS